MTTPKRARPLLSVLALSVGVSAGFASAVLVSAAQGPGAGAARRMQATAPASAALVLNVPAIRCPHRMPCAGGGSCKARASSLSLGAPGEFRKPGPALAKRTVRGHQ